MTKEEIQGVKDGKKPLGRLSDPGTCRAELGALV